MDVKDFVDFMDVKDIKGLHFSKLYIELHFGIVQLNLCRSGKLLVKRFPKNRALEITKA